MSRSGTSLLIVDDRPSDRLALHALLEDLADQVIHAGSGEEALALTAAQDFAAVLIDIRMPGMGGLEAARQILQRDPHRRTPLIFLTAADSTEEELHAAYAMGAVGYLQKPIQAEIVRAKVSTLTAMARQRMEGQAAAEARASHILESITEGFYSMDPEWRFTYFNRQSELFYGRSRHQLLGRVIWDEFPTVIGSPFEIQFRRAMADHLPVHFEVCSTVTGRWLQINAYPSEEGLSVYFSDITERRLAQAELRSTQERLRLVMDNVPALVSYVDRQGIYRSTNHAYQQWFRLPAEQVVGRHMREILGDAAYQQLLPHLRRALSGEQVTYETVLSYATGARWVHATYTPHTLSTGEVAGVVVMVNDITERKRVEEASASRGRTLQFLLDLHDATREEEDATRIMGTVTRMLGEHLGVNRCAYAEVEPDNDHFVIPDDYAQECQSIKGRYSLRAFGSRAYAELCAGKTFVTPDIDAEGVPEEELAAYRLTQIQAVVCTSLVKGGRMVALMAVHQTEPRAWTQEEIQLVEMVSERSWAIIQRVRADDHLRRVNAELASADRRKDEFLAMLGHELRNPLGSLSNGVYILRKRADGNTGLERTAEMVERQLRLLTRLVGDLQDVSRIQRGKLHAEDEELVLQDVLRDSLESTAPLIKEREHALSLDLPATPVTIRGDATRLHQVFSNLLSNAAKYTPVGGEIRLAAVRLEDRVRVSVTDTGVGINREALATVFELFAQSERTLGESKEGLGIGLALAKGLVQMHGGDIQVASSGPGQGCTFTVTLPLAARLNTIAKGPREQSLAEL